MLLKRWAEWQGVHYRTALTWYHEGVLPVPAYKVRSTILVGPIHPAPPPARVACLYLQGHLADLDSAIADLTRWAVSAQFLVASIITDNSPQIRNLRDLVRDTSVRQIITNRSADIPEEIVATLHDQNRSLLVTHLTTRLQR